VASLVTGPGVAGVCLSIRKECSAMLMRTGRRSPVPPWSAHLV